MNIEIKKVDNFLTFGDLRSGDVFTTNVGKDKDYIFIKVLPTELNNTVSAVSLKNGIPEDFSPNLPVIKLNGKFVED